MACAVRCGGLGLKTETVMRDGGERREPTWSASAGREAARGDDPSFGPIGRASGDAPAAAPRFRDDTPDLGVPPPPVADPLTRRIAVAAAALAGLLVVLVGAWSLLGHRHHGLVVISAPPGPVRVKPLNPGGLQVQALPSLGDDDGDGKPKLAPAPEQPRPAALQQQVDEARRDAAPPPAPESAPPPQAVVPAPQAVVPAPQAVAPAPQAVTPAPQAVTPAPEEDSTPASSKPEAAKPSEPAAPVKAAPASTPAGTHEVQLGALASEASARAEWKRLNARAPAVLAGHTPSIERVSHAGQIFWRLRTSGFDNTAQATEFCIRVRAAGGACTLAGF